MSDLKTLKELPSADYKAIQTDLARLIWPSVLRQEAITGSIAPQVGAEVIEFFTLPGCIDGEHDEEWLILVIAKEHRERQQ